MEPVNKLSASSFHDLLVNCDDASIASHFISKSNDIPFLNNYLQWLVKRIMIEDFSEKDYSLIEYLLLFGAEPMANYHLKDKCKKLHYTLLDLVMKTCDERLLSKFVYYLKYIDVPDLDPAKYSNNMEWTECKNSKVLAAVAYQSIHLVEYVLDSRFHRNQNEKSHYYGNTPLHIAVSMPNEIITKMLLNDRIFGDCEATNNRFETPLFYAVKHRQPAQVMLLHKYGAKFEAKDINCNTVLHILCAQKEEIDYRFFKLLLNRGCDPNSLGKCFRTPLHILAKNQHASYALQCAKLLIQRGANVNILNIYKDTVLHTLAYHCRNCDRFISFFNLLLENNINTKAVDEQGRTFLDVLLLQSSTTRRQRILKHLIFLDSRGEFKFGGQPMSYIMPDVQFEKLCRDELEVLESPILFDGRTGEMYSLKKIIESNERQIAELCRNRLLRAIMYRFKRIEFPIYGPDLINKYRSGLQLFLDEGEDFGCLDYFCEGVLDFYCMREIMEFIPPQDFGKLKSSIPVDVLISDEIEENYNKEKDKGN